MKPTLSSRLMVLTRARQPGFTLIELMVAITLGMLVVAAVLALYLNLTRTNNEMAKANRQIENGRFAIQLLENDIVHAGFWGEHVPVYDDFTSSAVGSEIPTAIPDPCVAVSSWDAAYKTNLIAIPVQGYAAATPSGSGCATDVSTNRSANTDVLVVRHAETCLPGVGNCEAYNANNIYLQSALCALEGSSYRLDTGTNIDTNPLHKKDCVGTGSPAALPITSGTAADKRLFVSNIYHVRDYPGTANDGVAIPTLMRSSFSVDKHQVTQQLIEGIEAFRVEFLIDNANPPCGPINYAAAITKVNRATCAVDADITKNTFPNNRGDGIPDAICYAGTCTVNDLMNAVAVRIYVLARNLEPTQGYQDDKTYQLGTLSINAAALPSAQRAYKRHVFSTTVRLNNVAGRRETP